ncbi:MAG: hypothetical protein WDM96_19860 [Lacunisphaera sp.]
MFDAEAFLIAARDHTGAGRHALRCTHIAVTETDAGRGERVEVRRLDVLVHTLNAEIGKAVVVAVNKNNVRLGPRWLADGVQASRPQTASPVKLK